jgi:ABC-2 type transport system permease protein
MMRLSVCLADLARRGVQNFLTARGISGGAPINLVVRADSNPNLRTAWFSAMTQVINQITLLTVILTGAALIREREQGTVDHLLVMNSAVGRSAVVGRCQPKA